MLVPLIRSDVVETASLCSVPSKPLRSWRCRQSDFLRILTEPDHNMLRQQQALLGTEGVDLEFAPDAVQEIAALAEQVIQNAVCGLSVISALRSSGLVVQSYYLAG